MLNEKEKNDIEIKQYTLLDLFRTLKYPRIPYFQREYKWSKKQVNELIDDISNFGTDNYYIGSVVIQNDNGKQWIIDGQQRISTFILIINELSKIAKFDKNDYLYELEEHLNEMNFESENAVDKNILELIIKSNTYDDMEKSNYQDISRFVESIIIRWSEEQYSKFINNLQHIIFACIEINSIKIDESVLFEKINSSGLPLSQFDLVKNYLLSKISKEIYNNDKISINYYVSELENITNFFSNENKGKLNDIDKEKSELIRAFISYKNKEKVKIEDIYNEFKRFLNKNESPIKVFDQLKKFSSYYLYIYKNKWNKNKKIYGPMLIIRRNLNTFITLVVNIFELNSNINENNEIIFDNEQEKEIVKLLLILESYIFRRIIVGLDLKIITKKIPQINLTLNKKLNVIQNLYQNLCIEPYEYGEEKMYRMPKFYEIKQQIIDNNLNIYDRGKNTLNILLFRLGTWNLNNFFEFDDKSFTIEHILPQNDNSWNLSSIPKEQIEIKKHVLGNLTLTNVNSKLQNQTFISKKKILLEEDNFPLNNYFRNIDDWNIEEIDKRTKILIDEMSKIWNFDYLENFFKNTSNLEYSNKPKGLFNDKQLIKLKNYDFRNDSKFKTAFTNRAHFKKVKDKFTIENITKIIELYAVDEFGYVDIERNIFEENFKGWLGQSIIEALNLDKKYDKGRIQLKNLHKFLLNEKWDDISKLIQFVEECLDY